MVSDGPWVELWLSPERFATYLRQAGNDRVRALDLHEWSAKMSAALLHDFAHLEVGIRNMYDTALMAAVVAGARHWSNAASAVVLFPDVSGSDRRTHRDLEVARKAAGGLQATGGKVLAELTFGFWVYPAFREHLDPLFAACLPSGVGPNENSWWPRRTPEGT